MIRVRSDLWETPPSSPFPGLTTHAYLWTGGPSGNVLLYAPGDTGVLEQLGDLGGVAAHYLSHRDEAGPVVAQVAERFGSALHAPAAEADDIGRFAAPDVLVDHRHVDGNGIEVVPAPGHTPGSTCYLVPGREGTYLCTGDTLYVDGHGRWTAGYLDGISDAAALAASLEVLATMAPDLVVSSAFTGNGGAHPIAPGTWPACVAEARTSLPGPG